MPLELIEIGTSAGVGIIDNILVELEEQDKITGNLTYIKDALRIIGAFGGLAVNTFVARYGKLEKFSGALALSYMPLAFHSIRKLVKGAIKAGYSGGWVLERLGQQQVSSTATGRIASVTSY
jgi:hypothetical protein